MVFQTFLRMKSPPPKTADLLKAMHSLMRPARAEKGFVLCRLYLDADDANIVSYEERWQTRADLETQLRSDRFTRLLTLMESASERPSLEFNCLSDTQGLEFVEAVRAGRHGQAPGHNHPALS